MTEARRHPRHLDRHGRGRRGPISRPSRYAPRGLPIVTGAAGAFDSMVADEVESLESRVPQLRGRVDFAVADVPPIGPDDAAIPLSRHETYEEQTPDQPDRPQRRTRVVLFRRPIETRAGADRDDLVWLVHTELVSRVADVLGVAPETIDPTMDPD